MDIASLIGLPLGAFAIIFAILIGGYPLSLYADAVSVFVTIVGSFAALMYASPKSGMMSMPTMFSLSFKARKSNIEKKKKTLVGFSEKSRREGLLSLEDEIEQLADDFFKQGIRLVVDGTDPEVIKNVLYNQLNGMQARHDSNRSYLDAWAKLAPAFGMLGTLYGLVGMLANMGDPSAIGRGMAAALITTFYGAIMANLILIPISTKLGIYSNDEVSEREMLIEGILAIQTGDNPRVVEEKLLAFVAPAERAKLKTTD
jgi:chemotaxis protein MotA